MKALCQDCMRVLDVSPMEFHDAPDGILKCRHCGGEVCDCPSCIACIKGLSEGDRDRDRLGLRTPGPEFDWTPDGGYVERVPS